MVARCLESVCGEFKIMVKATLFTITLFASKARLHARGDPEWSAFLALTENSCKAKVFESIKRTSLLYRNVL
jgi:hypothetical protein